MLVTSRDIWEAIYALKNATPPNTRPTLAEMAEKVGAMTNCYLSEEAIRSRLITMETKDHTITIDRNQRAGRTVIVALVGEHYVLPKRNPYDKEDEQEEVEEVTE